jgi:hypothetical protein
MAKERLMEIVGVLRSDSRFSERGHWSRAAKLVCEGIREVSAYDKGEIDADSDLADANKYLFTDQVPLYMGERSDECTRWLIRRALCDM